MKNMIKAAAALTVIFAASSAQAIVCDLTKSSTCVVPTVYGNAIFTTDFTRPAGSGVLDPFLSIQDKGVEDGYNTSAGVFDTKREPQYNHEIRLSDLATVTIDGAEYYSFLLDINEPNGGSKSQISLDMLQIYTSTKASQTTTDVSQLGTKRFDLDLPSDSYILYDDQNSGSGQADIAFFIPAASFLTGTNAAKPTDYVYMYQKFGVHVSADFDGSTQGGFEETSIGVGVTPIPEVPAALPLAGVLGGIIGFTHWRRRRSVSAA